ncbi:hypothetical protein EDC04DRAFT_2622892 [Pisolithus marmoratus]|nr:hypothetical protein EDC04DRAFT_2622892 [Pisolithus marmoratus]
MNLLRCRYRLPLPYSRRAFSFTSCVRQNDQQDLYSSFGQTSIFRKVADKPEALIALRDFAALLKDKGVDPTAGPPSVTQMLRLAANSDFRSAAQRVVTELQNAGVDLKSQDVLQELTALSKKAESG